MDRGIYIDGDSHIVFTGNRKPADPDDLTWKDDVAEGDWPEKIMDCGVYTSNYDAGAVIENPEYTTAKAARDTKISDLATAFDDSDFKDLSIADAKALVATKIDPASTIANIKTAIKDVFDNLLPLIIKQ